MPTPQLPSRFVDLLDVTRWATAIPTVPLPALHDAVAQPFRRARNAAGQVRVGQR